MQMRGMHGYFRDGAFSQGDQCLGVTSSRYGRHSRTCVYGASFSVSFFPPSPSILLFFFFFSCNLFIRASTRFTRRKLPRACISARNSPLHASTVATWCNRGGVLGARMLQLVQLVQRSPARERHIVATGTALYRHRFPRVT